MTTKYPDAFIEQALVKVFSRGSKSIKAVADELNVNHHTLKYWMKNKSVTASAAAGAKEKRPQDWTSAEQFVALQQTHGLAPEALQAWCREKGIFPHHLTSWQAAFCAPTKDAVAGTAELRLLKQENEKLKRDVLRKDKALAEAAALLILQKKFRALWDDEDK
jgi:transposase-like protein